VLKVNYRNATGILTTAMAILDGQPFDDIDGSVITTPASVETSYHDGTVVRVVAATADEHDNALITALTELTSDKTVSDGRPGDTAILCARTRDVAYYHWLLLRAGLPVCKLSDYDGQPVNAIKVGTFLRAKGLEFKYVFLPRHDEALHDAQHGGLADTDRTALAKRQLFVGMTRARDLLWLSTVAAHG